MACHHIGETSAPQQRETRRLPPPTPRSTALEQLLPKTSADAPGAPTGDDRVNPSADAKLDPTVGACLPPSQLLLFPEVLRRPRAELHPGRPEPLKGPRGRDRTRRGPPRHLFPYSRTGLLLPAPKTTFHSSLCDEAERPLFIAFGANSSLARGRGGVPKRPTGADCKSAGSCLRRFESSPHHSGACRYVGPDPGRSMRE